MFVIYLLLYKHLRVREPMIHDVSLFHGNPPVVWKRVHFSSLLRKLQMKVDN